MAEKIITSDYLLTTNELQNHFKVFAGPGAGKTYFLVQNIKNIIQNDKRMYDGNNRKVLCITYTNAAAEEIISRMSQYTDMAVISTIHSFVYSNIIVPFQALLKQFIKKKYNISIPSNIQLQAQVEGRGVLFRANSKSVKTEVALDFIKQKDCNAENITYTRAAIEAVTFDMDGNLNSTRSSKMPEAHKWIVKEFIWCNVGVLSHDEILLFGYELVKRYPIVRYSLRVLFPYVFIDEFQDTIPIQTKLIQLICREGSIAGVIGDSAQSIYGFLNAMPNDFMQFTIPEDSKRNVQTFIMNVNRRSLPSIIDFSGYLRQKDKSLSLQKCHKENEGDGKVTIFVEKGSDSLPYQISEYINNGAAVLTRSWAQAFSYIQGISAEQKKLLNDLNNIYSFQLNRDLRKGIVEYNDVDWAVSLKNLVTLQNAWDAKNLPLALDILSKYFDKKSIISNPLMLNRTIDVWKSIYDSLSDNISIADSLTQINSILPKYAEKGLNPDEVFMDFSNYENTEANSLKKIKEILDKLEYSTGKILATEVFSVDSKYMSIHSAKGREFDKVLACTTPTRGDGIESIIDVLSIPDINDTNEYMRIVYVACSRAIKELAIHFIGVDVSPLVQSIENWSKDKVHKPNIDVVYL